MLRVTILGFALNLILACATCPQEMRSDLKEYHLAGNVRSVETTVVETSTKSYKLQAGGREELEDFANPSEGAPASPRLWEALKFDATGKLMEDIDLERAMEQESYRYVYTYNQQGFLAERVGYRENGSFDERTVYSYGPGGRKTEEVMYARDGRVQGRYEFDEHGNFTSEEWYNEDGSVRRKVSHRYEYLSKGNTLEQVYYPPDPPAGVGLTVYAPLSVDPPKSITTSAPIRYRTLFVHDEAGRLREESRFYADDSLMEKKVFDQKGILRNREWRLGDMTATTTTFDDHGREIESHTVAKEGFGSPRSVDDRTLSSYDTHGNLTKMVTRDPGGSLVASTTNMFEYDSHGNWIKKTETVLTNTSQTEPFPAFESIREFRRAITYFPD